MFSYQNFGCTSIPCILHALLSSSSLIFMHYRSKPTHATHVTLRRTRKCFSLDFIKYYPYWKMYQIKVVDINEVCSLCNAIWTLQRLGSPDIEHLHVLAQQLRSTCYSVCSCSISWRSPATCARACYWNKHNSSINMATTCSLLLALAATYSRTGGSPLHRTQPHLTLTPTLSQQVKHTKIHLALFWYIFWLTGFVFQSKCDHSLQK
jgi:hypothetical protein